MVRHFFCPSSNGVAKTTYRQPPGAPLYLARLTKQGDHPMSQLSPTDIAGHLVNARKSHVAWDAGDTAGLSMEDVYAVQDLVTDQLGLEIGAWKTSPLEDPAAPFAAPIYARDIHASGAQIVSSDLFVIGLEGEIAFRFNRDFLSVEHPYTRDEIIAGISEMLPLIEVVDTRMVNGMEQDASLKMADNQSNAAIVIGDPVTSGWQDVDATTQAVSLTVNGETAYGPLSNSPVEDLFAMMAGTINVCAARGRPVKAGHIITTGSCTGLLFFKPGAEAVLEMPGVGRVEASFPKT